jgi:hypothetical protein
MKLAFIIRGHIRDGLFNSGLKSYLDYLSNEGHTIDLYLQTWTENEAKSSYRELDRSHIFKVTPELLRAYFNGYDVKTVMVQDDSRLKLKGDIDGLVGSSKCPKIAWKRMWAGKVAIAKYLYDNGGENYDRVVNTRYDMFTNPICITPNIILNKITKQSQNLAFRYPLCQNGGMVGIDNYYVGSSHAMLQLASDFHTSLDAISEIYSDVAHQEEMVCRHGIKNYT